MQNVIQLALKWLFFPENYKIAKRLRSPLPKPPSVEHLVAPVCSARRLNETFSEQKNYNFRFKPPLPRNEKKRFFSFVLDKTKMKFVFLNKAKQSNRTTTVAGYRIS